MRCITVSQAKMIGKSRFAAPLKSIPREGSRVRAAYDFFYANKGVTVEFQFDKFGGDNNLINKLTDFYGLDIRRIRNGSARVGRVSTWVLAGEWFGRVYVDYIAERAATHDRIAS
jgi:hypothetical protein